MAREMSDVLRDRARLGALQRTALLDTAHDPDFDRLSRLAIRLLNAPVALVSLVDENRQFFKSCVGLAEPWATKRETGLEHSFCKHVVHTGQPLIISDARQEPMVKDNLAIRDIGVVAYLGIPLLVNEQVVGSFCVIDGVPRVWKPDDISTLQEIARSVLTEIHLRMEAAEREQAQVELQRAHDELEIRVRERTAEFLALNEVLEQRVKERTAKLEQANADLEAFAYSVSHDLKAPLWAISGFGDILAADHRGSLNAEGQKYLDMILQSTAKMTRLIDDLMAYARLGRKAIQPQLLDLRDLFAQVAQSQDAHVKATGAQVMLPADAPKLVSDRALLSQIFSNLLDNALKFRKKDVPPKITFSVREESGGVVVCVADNGIGVPDKYKEQIFNVFKRLHTEKEYPGTGVGLALVQRAAKLLGGSAWEESNPEGSTFCVKLRSIEQTKPA